ncbi:MAG: chloride channel protein [Candidatus Binatia bacterium]
MSFAGRWLRIVAESNAWLTVAAVLIGVLTALANVAFHWSIHRADLFFWDDIGHRFGLGTLLPYDIFATGLSGIPDNWWYIPIIPVLGMAMIVILDVWFPGEMKGYGMPRFLELVNVKGGFIKRRWITLKTLSSAITLGSGMSAGIEGPIAQIGGSIGSTVGRALRPSQDRLRVLIACGSASAIAATFGSPIAGVMFAQEIVLIGEVGAQAFYLIVLAAGVSTVASLYLRGDQVILVTPEFEWPLNHELLFLVLMGLMCGLLAVFFIRSFFGIREAFESSPIPSRLLPLVGGALVGLSLIVFPHIASSGYDVMNTAFRGEMGGTLLLALVFVKILTTGVTLGCGGSGGVFAPAMFIGVAFGGGFAEFVNTVLPGTIGEPGSFALVGMGAFLAGATHAPMTAIFLVFELTRDYNAVVPAMITSVAATLVARRMMNDSIDTYELSQRGLNLHAGQEAHILRKLYVRSLVSKDFEPIPESMPVTDFVRYVTNSHHMYFPVVNNEGELSGMVSLQDLRGVLLDSEAWPFLVVGELAHKEIRTVKLSDTLHDAMQVIATMGWEQVPVVDDETQKRVVGMLRRADLQDFYQKRLLARELHG